MVSTYAGESLIRGTLEMLIRQTAVDQLEIIVVDSGSPQDERSVVESLQRECDNIAYVRTPRETLYAAWNRALEMSTGTYFANVNVDDWIRHDALEVFARAMDRHQECDLAFAHWAITDEAQRRPTDCDPVSFHPPYEPVLPLFYCYGGSTQFWRRSSLVNLGGFDESFTAAGDLDALCRLTLAKGNAVLVPQLLEGFFQNPHGISRATDTSTREEVDIKNRARAQTPLNCLYAIDRANAGSVAAGWTALGNKAVETRVPWHTRSLNDVHVALGFYERALAAAPGCPEALHNRYVLLFTTGRFEEAERSLDHLAGAGAARIRGAGAELLHPSIEPAVRGPVFED